MGTPSRTTRASPAAQHPLVPHPQGETLPVEVLGQGDEELPRHLGQVLEGLGTQALVLREAWAAYDSQNTTH
mgnify:CR=1 FL=1